MLLHILLVTLMQAFTPANDRMATDFELRLHAGAETLQPVGAAGHVARYTPLPARGL